MTYTLSWHIPERVLYLTLDGQPALSELQSINREVMEILDQSESKIHLVLDVLNLRAGYDTSNHLRDTQQYMNHANLEGIFVVAENKLNRLITLMAFCFSRAYFAQFDNFQNAEAYFKRRGIARM